MSPLLEATALLLACVLFSTQLVICGFLGTRLVRVVDKAGRRP